MFLLLLKDTDFLSHKVDFAIIRLMADLLVTGFLLCKVDFAIIRLMADLLVTGYSTVWFIQVLRPQYQPATFSLKTLLKNILLAGKEGVHWKAYGEKNGWI